MSIYPKLVGLALDYTVWNGSLDAKESNASSVVEDNLELVDGSDPMTVRDKSDNDRSISLYSDVPRIITDLATNGVQIAIVARNTNKAVCDRALWLFKAVDPKTNQPKSITDFINYSEIYDQSKVEHFKKIKEWSGFNYSTMLLFDNEAPNSEVEKKLGVTFKVLRDKKGLTWSNYQDGLAFWRRIESIRVPFVGSDLALYPKKQFVGYVGTDLPNAIEYQNGRRRLDARTSRWGYGMYLTDNLTLALFFSDWNRSDRIKAGKDGNMYICSVYARDVDVFNRLPKIWVPERDYLQTFNATWNDSQITWKQEDRDDLIAEKYGVKKPYILFARHSFMEGMPIERDIRFNEMAVYPQLQDALFIGHPVPTEDVRAAVKRGEGVSPVTYESMFKPWNITVPQDTADDFIQHGESFIF